MRNLMLVTGFLAAATVFVIAAAYKRKNRSRTMTFWELYDDNDVELEGLLND